MKHCNINKSDCWVNIDTYDVNNKSDTKDLKVVNHVQRQLFGQAIEIYYSSTQSETIAKLNNNIEEISLDDFQEVNIATTTLTGNIYLMWLLTFDILTEELKTETANSPKLCQILKQKKLLYIPAKYLTIFYLFSRK